MAMIALPILSMLFFSLCLFEHFLREFGTHARPRAGQSQSLSCRRLCHRRFLSVMVSLMTSRRLISNGINYSSSKEREGFPPPAGYVTPNRLPVAMPALTANPPEVTSTMAMTLPVVAVISSVPFHAVHVEPGSSPTSGMTTVEAVLYS